VLGLIRAEVRLPARPQVPTYAVLWIKQAIQRSLDNTGRRFASAHIAQRERRERSRPSSARPEPRATEGIAEQAKLPLDEVKAVRDLTRVTTAWTPSATTATPRSASSGPRRPGVEEVDERGENAVARPRTLPETSGA
jgi:hypothetical protein